MDFQLKKTVVEYDLYGESSMRDLLVFIMAVLAGTVVLFAMCCYCMRRSDKKLQKYVLNLAKCRGRKLDPKELKRPHSQTPTHSSALFDSCPVLLAEAGIIIP